MFKTITWLLMGVMLIMLSFTLFWTFWKSNFDLLGFKHKKIRAAHGSPPQLGGPCDGIAGILVNPALPELVVSKRMRLHNCSSVKRYTSYGWLEFAGVENDRPAKNRGWNLQDWNMKDWKMTDWKMMCVMSAKTYKLLISQQLKTATARYI